MFIIQESPTDHVAITKNGPLVEEHGETLNRSSRQNIGMEGQRREENHTTAPTTFACTRMRGAHVQPNVTASVGRGIEFA